MKNFLLLLVLLPVLVFSQSRKKYPTLLWKISGNNIKKPSYLYGTMHVSNRVAYHLSEQFFDALRNVDVVGLETNPGEWLENMEKTGELSELNQFRNNTFSQDFYRTAFTARFPEKKTLQGVLSYDPDIIDGLLYRQNHSRENFEESTYIDLFIFQSASKLNKQLISLEDFSTSEIKARLSALPDDSVDESKKDYSNYYYLTQKIEDAYREGNLDLLDSLSKLTSSKNTQKFLIDDRNVFFVNTIDSVLKTKAIFSGVGAAHLPGANGVIELLRKKGYTVEPVPPRVSKKSHAMREHLDVKIKPVAFKNQVISDSLFSVHLPGKLYPIISLDNLKYYIYADMVNGSFYTIMRLRHMGPVFNVSAAQLMARVDSLLFESIPGKLLLKKEINAGDIKGIEIVNRTRRGDEQHYQIFFTDVEMILFKLGGKSNYATGSEARQFFNSISFTQKNTEIINFTPKTKGFSVKIPATYSYHKNEGSSAIGIVEELYTYSPAKKQSYGVKRYVYNDFYYLEEDTFELSRLAKSSMANYGFTLSAQKSFGNEQGFPCIKFSAANAANKTLTAKIFIKGVHYYFVYTIGQSEDYNSDFFNSFKLTDFAYVHTLKEVTDKDFYFKVIDEVSENALSRFNEAYAKAYDAAHKKKDSLKNSYEYKSGTKFYYSPSSNEYVNILIEKYNDYDYKNISEINKKIADTFKNTSSLMISKPVSSFKNGLYAYSCTLKDTATVRAIDIKIFIRNGMMHEICVPYDTTIGLRGWAKGFMESFTPKDTIVGRDIFSNKFGILLNDLCSTDTVKRQAAYNSLRTTVGMQKAYSNEFVKFITNERLELVSEDSRAYLFVNGGTIGNEEIIEPYKKLYMHYTDSFYLQLCLLKGLAYLKTKDSYAAFNKLLLAETPLVGSDNSVNDVFNVLHDSLELCKQFYPAMLTLAKYDEYRDAVYALMADLINQKLLSPAAYASQKESILIDANLALKRYSPSASRPGVQDYGTVDFADKNVRDLAETIKNNLEALANNNLYKTNKRFRNIDFYTRPSMVNYAYVLSPFYKTDEKIRLFFSKLSKIKNQDVAMPVAINLLEKNVLINDTIVNYYCRNKYTSAFFYSELEKEKLTSWFDKKHLSQQSLAESVLISQRQLNALYDNDKERNKKDSLVFMHELPAYNKYQKGKIYLFKAAKNKTDEEQWSVAFVPLTNQSVTTRIEVVSSGYFIDGSKSEQENINDLLDYFYLNYRKRASPEGIQEAQ